MRVLVLLLAFACFSIVNSQTPNPPAFRFTIQTSVVQKLMSLLPDQIITPLLNSTFFPIPLTNETSTNPSFSIFDSVSTSIARGGGGPNNTLEIIPNGVSATFDVVTTNSFTLVWNHTNKISGETTLTANLTADLTFVLNAAGKLVFSSSANLIPHTIEYPTMNLPKELEAPVHAALLRSATQEFGQSLSTKINHAIQSKIDALWDDGGIVLASVAGHNVTLSLNLTKAPSFTTELISFELQGDIVVTGFDMFCTRSALPAYDPSLQFEVIMNTESLTCFLQKAGVIINAVAENYLDPNIMMLDVNINPTLELAHPYTFFLSLDATVNLMRKVEASYNKILELEFQILKNRLTLIPLFSQQMLNISVSVSNITNLKAPYVSPSVPERFKQQIQEASFEKFLPQYFNQIAQPKIDEALKLIPTSFDLQGPAGVLFIMFNITLDFNRAPYFAVLGQWSSFPLENTFEQY